MVMKAQQKKNIHLKPETYFPIRIFDRFRALPQGPSCLESGGELFTLPLDQFVPGEPAMQVPL